MFHCLINDTYYEAQILISFFVYNQLNLRLFYILWKVIVFLDGGVFRERKKRWFLSWGKKIMITPYARPGCQSVEEGSLDQVPYDAFQHKAASADRSNVQKASTPCSWSQVKPVSQHAACLLPLLLSASCWQSVCHTTCPHTHHVLAPCCHLRTATKSAYSRAWA